MTNHLVLTCFFTIQILAISSPVGGIGPGGLTPPVPAGVNETHAMKGGEHD